MAGWEERVGERFRGWAVFGVVLGAEGGEAIGLVVPGDASMTRDPAGLDGEGSGGEHGEDFLEEVVEFGVMAEAFAEGVDTNLAVREDDTKAGRGSLREVRRKEMAIPIAQASPKLLVPRPRQADSRTGGRPGCMMKAPAPEGPGLGVAEPSV